ILYTTTPRSPRTTLFPYTTLFRSWTIEQFAQAALALTEFDEDGNPTRIGFFGDTRLMLRSLLGENLYDDSTGLTIPRFDNPELRSEEHTSELQSRENIVCRLLLEK